MPWSDAVQLANSVIEFINSWTGAGKWHSKLAPFNRLFQVKQMESKQTIWQKRRTRTNSGHWWWDTGGNNTTQVRADYYKGEEKTKYPKDRKGFTHCPSLLVIGCSFIQQMETDFLWSPVRRWDCRTLNQRSKTKPTENKNMTKKYLNASMRPPPTLVSIFQLGV